MATVDTYTRQEKILLDKRLNIVKTSVTNIDSASLSQTDLLRGPASNVTLNIVGIFDSLVAIEWTDFVEGSAAYALLTLKQQDELLQGEAFINVQDYAGVDPTGSTYSDDGIEAALEDALAYQATGSGTQYGDWFLTTGNILYFPKGIYKIKRTIVIEDKNSNVFGPSVILRGAGMGPTTISFVGEAGTAAGQDIIKMRNAYNTSIEDMCIKSSRAEAYKNSAIVSILNNPLKSGFRKHNMVRNCFLGGVDDQHHEVCVRIGSEGTHTDANNDFHFFDHVTFSGGTEANVSIEASQAMGHQFVECFMTGGPIGIAVSIGQFAPLRAFGTVTITATGVSVGATVTLDVGSGPAVFTAGNTEDTAIGQFNRSGTSAAAAQSLADCINRNSNIAAKAFAYVVDNKCYVRAVVGGTAGNAFTMASSDATDLALSGATFSGGTAGIVVSASSIGGPYRWYGGGCGGHCLTDFQVSPQGNDPFIIEGCNSEGSARLVDGGYGPAAVTGSVIIRGNRFATYGIHPDFGWVRFSFAPTILIEGNMITASDPAATLAKVLVHNGASNPFHLALRNNAYNYTWNGTDAPISYTVNGAHAAQYFVEQTGNCVNDSVTGRPITLPNFYDGSPFKFKQVLQSGVSSPYSALGLTSGQRISLDEGASTVKLYGTTNQLNIDCALTRTNGNILAVGSIKSVTNGGGIESNGKYVSEYTDATGTPGDTTINKPTGRASLAAGATAVVVTNGVVSTNSNILIVPLDIDATVAKWKVNTTAGSFTVTVDAAATANWRFAFFVFN